MNKNKFNNDMKLIMENWRKYSHSIASDYNISIDDLKIYEFHDKKTLKENKNLNPIKKEINLKLFLEKYEQGKISEGVARKTIIESLEYDEKKINEASLGDMAKKAAGAVSGVAKKVVGAVSSIIKKGVELAIKAALFVASSIMKFVKVSIIISGKAARGMINAAKSVLRFFGVKDPSTRAAVVLILGTIIVAVALLAAKLGMGEANTHSEIMKSTINAACPGLLGESIISAKNRKILIEVLQCGSLPQSMSAEQIESICRSQHGEPIVKAAKELISEAAQNSGGEAFFRTASEQMQQTTNGVVTSQSDNFSLVDLGGKAIRKMLEIIQTIDTNASTDSVANQLDPEQAKIYAEALQEAAREKLKDPSMYDALVSMSDKIRVFYDASIQSTTEISETLSNKESVVKLREFGEQLVRMYLKVKG